jgi:hypothetical protein
LHTAGFGHCLCGLLRYFFAENKGSFSTNRCFSSPSPELRSEKALPKDFLRESLKSGDGIVFGRGTRSISEQQRDQPAHLKILSRALSNNHSRPRYIVAETQVSRRRVAALAVINPKRPSNSVYGRKRQRHSAGADAQQQKEKVGQEDSATKTKDKITTAGSPIATIKA